MKNPLRLVFVLSVLLLLLPVWSAAQELEIVNIRVGQGDATLIRGPVDAAGERIDVLFDAGDISDRDGGHILSAVLNKRGVEELDYLIISHDDADHMGGAVAGPRHGRSFIFGFNRVPGEEGDDDGDGDVDWLPGEEFFVPDPEELGRGDDLPVLNFVDYGDEFMRGTQTIRKYQAIANRMGQRHEINDQAEVDDFEIDLGGGAKMICYAANGFVRGRASRVEDVDTPNERSLAFLITLGKFDFLLSGDLIGRKSGQENARMEEAVGEALSAAGVDIEILHVNHHGANNGSEMEFLKLIKPEIAIISAGNGNGHRHPTNRALKRLVEAGVDRIIQTSWGTTEKKMPLEVRDHQAIYQGDIVVTTDGDSFEISTARRWKID